jgi:hypothetical protein
VATRQKKLPSTGKNAIKIIDLSQIGDRIFLPDRARKTPGYPPLKDLAVRITGKQVSPVAPAGAGMPLAPVRCKRGETRLPTCTH